MADDAAAAVTAAIEAEWELAARLTQVQDIDADIARARARADAAIEDAIRAGWPILRIAALTGRDRAGLHRRRDQIRRTS